MPDKLAAPGTQAAEALAQLRVGVKQALKDESAGLDGARDDIAQLDTERAVARQRATEAVGEQMQVGRVRTGTGVKIGSDPVYGVDDGGRSDLRFCNVQS